MTSKWKRLDASIRKAAVRLASSTPLTRRALQSRNVWRQLDPYQRNAATRAIEAKRFALFFEQGTGKTWIAGAVAERVLTDALHLALFVVPLANIETTWTKFFREQLPNVHLCRTLDEAKEAIILGIVDPRPIVLLLHYEDVSKYIDVLRKVRWQLIVYDESQRLKNRATQQSRDAAKFKYGEYRLALSGTPMDEEPQDLWAQFRFLDKTILGHRYKDFEEQFFEPIELPSLEGVRRGSWQWNRLIREIGIKRSRRKFDMSKRHRLSKIIAPHCLRVVKEDVLDLPEMQKRYEWVTLRGKQRVLYEEMRDKLVASGMDLTAPLKVTQMSKLQQITGGYVIDDNGYTHAVGRAKMRRVASILKRLQNEPAVIFTRYVAEAQGIARELIRLGRSVATITGETGKADRTRIVEMFQEGRLQTIVSQIKTGGVGIDLYRSCHLIVYSPTFSHIDFDQAIARVYRRGQTRAVTIYMIAAQNTIDEYIYEALVSKQRKTKIILNSLKGKSYGRCKEEGGARRKEGRDRVQVRSRRRRHEARDPARQRSHRAA